MGVYSLSKSGINVGLNKYKNLACETLIAKRSNYKPSGTTRVFSHTFADGTSITEEGTINSVQGGVFTATETINNKYLIYYAAGFAQPTGSGDPLSNGNGIKINNIPAMNGVNYTFIGWYKGIQNQTNSATWSATACMYGDPRGSVYIGLGISDGKICIGSNGQAQGTTIINDEKWHMLTWVIKSNNTADAYVDGSSTPNISNKDISSSPSNNLLDYVGVGYPYGGSVSLNVAAGLQVYSQALSTSQISEIYNAEKVFFGV